MGGSTHTYLAYIICAALIIIYASDRFNTPLSNRSSTRQLLYWQSCFGYILSALSLFLALSVLLEQPAWRTLLQLKENQSLPAPLLATLAMTTLLPSVPILKRVDRWLLDLFLDWGAIPAEAMRRAAALRPHDFTVTGADVDALRKEEDGYGQTFASHLRQRGVTGLKRSRLRFTRVVKLYAQIQQLEKEPGYSRFFKQNADEFAALGRQVEGFIRGAVGKLDFAARPHALAADAAYQEVLQDRDQTFGADCRERFIVMARFLARAVLRSEPSEKDIIARLRRIGFPGAEPMNVPVFPINSLTALGLGLFAYLSLTSYLFSYLVTKAAPAQDLGALSDPAFMIATKVTLVRVATLALTVWLIQRYAFFRRNPGDSPRYFAYLVNGIAAAALTAAIGGGLHLLDPDPVAGLRNELPLVLLSLMLCTSVAFCCDDWAEDDNPPWWLRPYEAIGCGAVMSLGMVIIHLADLSPLKPADGWLLAAFIGLPGALGMIVGACVPHIYRESRRAAAARRDDASKAELAPADAARLPVAAVLLAPAEARPCAPRRRPTGHRRGAQADPIAKAGHAG